MMILASSSPSRLSILRSAGIEPTIEPPTVDENAILRRVQDQSPEQQVCVLAHAKASAIAARHLTAVHPPYEFATPGQSSTSDDTTTRPRVVIGADSMLYLDGELQGKPHTIDETIRRWTIQRGKTARLITGHCIINLASTATNEDTVLEATTTTVHFAHVSDADIRAYANSGEPLYCAGAFTLEAMGGWFIDRIEGDPSSVIGLSLPLVRRALYRFGYHVADFWNCT